MTHSKLGHCQASDRNNAPPCKKIVSWIVGFGFASFDSEHNESKDQRQHLEPIPNPWPRTTAAHRYRLNVIKTSIRTSEIVCCSVYVNAKMMWSRLVSPARHDWAMGRVVDSVLYLDIVLNMASVSWSRFDATELERDCNFWIIANWKFSRHKRSHSATRTMATFFGSVRHYVCSTHRE